jgi:hypothetical protein
MIIFRPVKGDDGMIVWQDLQGRVNGDPEFRLAARFWNATLRLDVGATSHRVRFEEGALTEVASCAGDAPCDLFIGASEDDWRELLAPVPRPFYQDLFGAALQHGVRLPEDPLAYAAYYAALRRLMQLLSASREEGR